jgi:hypothetical protein
VTFADGDTAEFDVVVWATGFTSNHSWIDVPGAKDEQGRILHQRGVTPSAGLYLLGQTWQHTRPRCSDGSATTRPTLPSRSRRCTDEGATFRGRIGPEPDHPQRRALRQRDDVQLPHL